MHVVYMHEVVAKFVLKNIISIFIKFFEENRNYMFARNTAMIVPVSLRNISDLIVQTMCYSQTTLHLNKDYL